MANYGIKPGQIYVAADGSKCGKLVIDTAYYESCDDVVTLGFTNNGFDPIPTRIDTFKLAQVRYSLVDAEKMPEWVQQVIYQKR